MLTGTVGSTIEDSPVLVGPLVSGTRASVGEEVGKYVSAAVTTVVEVGACVGSDVVGA
jgi:hypothetical protein